MENCFWDKFQENPTVGCVIHSLLTKKANFTKPACEGVKNEYDHLMKLREAQENLTLLLKDCNCPKRCNLIEYHVFGDPAPLCQGSSGLTSSGMAKLYFSVPSKRVAILHFHFF